MRSAGSARAVALALVVAVAMSPLRAAAADERSAAALQTTATDVSRKLALLETLIQSPTTRSRLDASTDPEALGHYEKAQQAWQTGAAAAEANEWVAATAAINQGYRLVSLALARAGDEGRRQRRAEERYAELRQRVFSFSEAFQRIAYEKNDPEVSVLLDARALSGLLSEAEALATAGRHSDANRLLERAAARVERAVTASRASETLLHALEFKSPEDEYAYERRRNESYDMLMELFEQNREASVRALAMMRRMLARNAAARADAERLYEKGDVGAAIEVLEQSSQEASRVLQMSGLAF